MSLDVTALSNWTNEHTFELITSSVAGAKTARMMTIQAGIKSAMTINIVDTDADFQDGSSCGFNASGSTPLTQRTITVGNIKVHEALCPKDLNAKWTQWIMNPGKNESIPFEQQYAEKKAALIADQMEVAIWQGDTGSGNPNLARFDGLIKLIDAAGSAVDGNTGAVTVATGITQSNAHAILQGMYKSIPVSVLMKDDMKIFVGFDTYRLWTCNLQDLNLFHYDANSTDFELVLPGTNITVVAVNGLTGTDRIFAMRTSNMYLGTDLEGEEDRFEMFWAKEADEFRFMAEWKAGTNVAFPDEIVEFTLVP